MKYKQLLSLIVILEALLLCTVTGRLQIYEIRVKVIDSIFEAWKVEGVATVELGADDAPTFLFDCNTTVGDGSGISWYRELSTHNFAIEDIQNGKRLNLASVQYQDLGVYVCMDASTGDELRINITNSNPAVCAVEASVGIIVGLSVQLSVYVSGIPRILSDYIVWYGPDDMQNEIGTSDATFQDSRRQMVLSNVETSDAGTYWCEVSIPLEPSLGLYLQASTSIQLEVYVPSEITGHPQTTTTIEEWQDIVLVCSASGSPLPDITWEREGGEKLPVNSREDSTTTNGVVTSTLTITEVRYEDAGKYRCVADNVETAAVYSEYGEIIVRAALRLEASINGVSGQMFSDLIFISIGSNLVVECFGSGTLAWKSSMDVTIPSSNAGQLYQLPDHSRDVQALHINDFGDMYVATYTCFTDLTDVFGQPVEMSVLITTSNPAVFITMEIQYALEGASTTLNATVYAVPQVDKLEWYLNDSLLDPQSDPNYSLSNGGSTLHITSVGVGLQGRYTLEAHVGNQTASDGIFLTIPDPPIVLVTPSAISVDIDDEVRFLCKAEGTGPLVIEWRMDSVEGLPEGISQEDEGENGTELVIASVGNSHIGTYICSVTNLAGTVETSAVLNVFFAPTATVSYQQTSTTTTNPTLSFTFFDGDTGPTFVCTATGHFRPLLAWTYNGNNQLPSGVVSTDISSGDQPSQELAWERELEYSDSGVYTCTAVNDNGTNAASVDLSVLFEPVINSIFPTSPVKVSDSSSPGLTTYAVPNGHSGLILTCSTFAWPPPSVIWVQDDGDLPDGVTSDMEGDGGVISARLRWTRGFTSSDVGTYTCLMNWRNETISEMVEIVKSLTDINGTTDVPPTCVIDSVSVTFQLRVLSESCDQWEMSLYEHIQQEFQKDLLRIIEIECRCDVLPEHIVIESLTCSSEMEGAVVFIGKIQTDNVSLTEGVYCALETWQQSGSLVNVNERLHAVDPDCNLQVMSGMSTECSATASTSSPDLDLMIIILIVAPVGGVIILAILIVLFVICCLCCCSQRSGRKRQRTWSPPGVVIEPKYPASLQRVMNNSSSPAFYGGANPSPGLNPRDRLSNSTEHSLLFDDSVFQPGTRPNTDPSPEHIPLRSASIDRLMEYTDSPISPRVHVTTSTGTNAQPYQLPVISTGSLNTTQLHRSAVPRPTSPPSATNPISLLANGNVSRSRLPRPTSPPSATNPISLLANGNVSRSGLPQENRRTSHESAIGVHRRVSYENATVGNRRPSSEGSSSPTYAAVNRRPVQGFSNPMESPAPAAYMLPVVQEREDSPPSNAARHSISALRIIERPFSSSSSIKLAPSVMSPSRESAMSEDLPPYSSRPPSLSGARPWYETESDMSIDRSSRRSNTYNMPYVSDDVQPYATIHNSAIPLITSRMSLPGMSPAPLPPPPRARPYAEPVRSSLDTLSNVQGTSNFQTVTV